jgi:hypothetical protein
MKSLSGRTSATQDTMPRARSAPKIPTIHRDYNQDERICQKGIEREMRYSFRVATLRMQAMLARWS